MNPVSCYNAIHYKHFGHLPLWLPSFFIFYPHPVEVQLVRAAKHGACSRSHLGAVVGVG